jgi:DNA-binding beta-propeller fold protein YncE
MQTQPAEIAESRTIKKERQKETKKQLVKVLGLLALLLALLLLLVLLMLPGFLDRGNFRFLYSVYRLSQPLGVSISDDGDFYVSEPQKNRLLAFDANGELRKIFGTTKGKGQVKAVYGSAIDERRDEVYIADFTERVVHVFDKEGKFLRRFPEDPFHRVFGERGFGPFDVEFYRDKVYVATRNGLVVFDRRGKLQAIWGRQRGSEIGEFNFVNGIAINKETGDIFLSDSLNRRVVALNNKGQIKWIAGQPDEEAKILSKISLPRGIDIDAWGRLYVADAFEHRILVLDQDGSLVSVIGERGVEDEKFNFPEGLAIANNRLVVADRANDRVQVFNLGLNLPQPDAREKRQFDRSLSQADKGEFLGRARQRLRFVDGKLAPGQKL